MSLEKFIQLFEQEFDEVERGSITPDKNFREVIQLNSMNMLLLLGFIKVEYGIDLSVEDVMEDATFKVFYEKHIQPNEIKNG
jgi:acyl carrier protein